MSYQGEAETATRTNKWMIRLGSFCSFNFIHIYAIFIYVFKEDMFKTKYWSKTYLLLGFKEEDDNEVELVLDAGCR